MDAATADRYSTLKEFIGSFESALIAYSGGVDSSLVAYVTAEVLGAKALAVTSGSPSLKRSDLALSETLARKWGMPHRVIVTDEMDNPEYRANPVNRCFHCKTSLYEHLDEIARTEGFEVVFNGTNVDDLGDHRPGLMAADNFDVRSPLVETGFHKADIRTLAAHLGLDNAQKPQSACLSSRVPYGTAIDEGMLRQIERAESALLTLGFSQFRVRHHGDVARLEIVPEEFEAAMLRREAIVERVKACGYRFVALDLAGFRSGSMNEGVVQTFGLSAT
ncbi:MAG: ATP-dependent sacrificial sulfur transferase LarE [Gammaproteobacteria bacterium]|nr:ATP-dependent sacrificial sulfur transferase LarE [Gammaproteobacteria bacterium]